MITIGADLVEPIELLERLGELAVDLEGQRVEARLAIERDRRDAARRARGRTTWARAWSCAGLRGTRWPGSRPAPRARPARRRRPAPSPGSAGPGARATTGPSSRCGRAVRGDVGDEHRHRGDVLDRGRRRRARPRARCRAPARTGRPGRARGTRTARSRHRRQPIWPADVQHPAVPDPPVRVALRRRPARDLIDARPIAGAHLSTAPPSITIVWPWMPRAACGAQHQRRVRDLVGLDHPALRAHRLERGARFLDACARSSPRSASTASVDHLGLDPARAQRVDRDAGAREIDRERAGHPDHRVLRRAVRRGVAVAGHARVRGDVDDPAPPGLDHRPARARGSPGTARSRRAP